MYQVNKLYIKFTDEDGHSYLIDKDLCAAFDEAVENAWEAFTSHGDNELYYEEYENILDQFGAIRIEGDEVFTVLPKDVVTN